VCVASALSVLQRERGLWETKAEVSVCCVCVECFAKGERGVGDKGGGECVLRLR